MSSKRRQTSAVEKEPQPSLEEAANALNAVANDSSAELEPLPVFADYNKKKKVRGFAKNWTLLKTLPDASTATEYVKESRLCIKKTIKGVDLVSKNLYCPVRGCEYEAKIVSYPDFPHVDIFEIPLTTGPHCHEAEDYVRNCLGLTPAQKQIVDEATAAGFVKLRTVLRYFCSKRMKGELDESVQDPDPSRLTSYLAYQRIKSGAPAGRKRKTGDAMLDDSALDMSSSSPRIIIPS